jgi:nicotinamidase/pyrazinamidase
MRNNVLFIVDGQNTFMGYSDGRAYKERLPSGLEMTAELPVAGAVEDMDRLTSFIDCDARGSGIDQIIFTLDTHERFNGDRDIGHAYYWKGSGRETPAPFTTVTYEDVVSGKWVPYDPGLYQKALKYLSAVGEQTIWPPHARFATWGHDMYGPLMAAIRRWEGCTGKSAMFVCKGMNCHTEQYGAFEAAVPDPRDPTTQFNWTLFNILRRGTRVYAGGEAMSHCVNSSVRQAAEKLTDEECARWTLLEDCMSSVAGFEAHGRIFIADMRSRGMKIEKSVP